MVDIPTCCNFSFLLDKQVVKRRERDQRHKNSSSAIEAGFQSGANKGMKMTDIHKMFANPPVGKVIYKKIDEETVYIRP